MVKSAYDMMKKIYFALPYKIQICMSKYIWKPYYGKSIVIANNGPIMYYGKVIFGDHVRIAGKSFFANVAIGNYSIFAEGFRIMLVHHDYRAFAVKPEIRADVKVSRDIIICNGIEPGMKNYGDTVIGNDVWVGEYVTIKGGVKVGDGAIVAAQSVVTHDVEPFSIVAGNPAKFIKWRFDEDTIKYLKKIQWWNWTEESIKENYSKLCMFDRSLENSIY